MIKAEHVTFEYFRRDEEGNISEIVEAVKDISLRVKPGEFIGILGQNGSGKSTFARLLNALLIPSEGSIIIAGLDSRDSNNQWKIRRNAGMVFQNPDNQIIGTMVEEDVAFGPENLGVKTEEIEKRVTEALETVGMTAYYQQSPNYLSGGQKQRVAIAGVLAMHPKCIVFDEATAMLDPQGRREVLNAARTLNQEQKITILFITHDMDEVISADRIVVMHQGELVLEGTPGEVYEKKEQLEAYGLLPPKLMELSGRLRRNGIGFSEKIMNSQEFISEVNRLKVHAGLQVKRHEEVPVTDRKKKKEILSSETDAMMHGLVLNHVSYSYHPNTAYESHALNDISLAISKGEFIAIIGHTGSGKSTLIQHLNGLLKPTDGQIYYEGRDIYDKGYNRTYLREKVGLVFQYPEYQLFAETVLEDVSFGPKNLKLPLLEIQQRAFQAIAAVGLSDNVYDLSPFELSGGQKRRVAIAGVLAMKPDFLVLDEPAVGLDPAGRKELLEMLKALHEEGMTIILVSHSMEDVAEYAERIIVMDQGRILYDDKVSEVFCQEETLRELGLDIPFASKLMKELKAEGHAVRTDIYKIEDVVTELTRYLS